MLQKGLCGLMDGCGLATGGPALAKRMVRYAHLRGIVRGRSGIGVNENGSGCLVEIKGVTLHFGAKMIFNDLNLEIRRGECLVLLGPSGIGKSTLLRLLIKTLNPERGSILFHGADITHLPRAQLNRIRTRIGMVFQSSALVSSMCVSENLVLPLRELTTKTEREIATIVEETALRGPRQCQRFDAIPAQRRNEETYCGRPCTRSKPGFNPV